MYAIIVLVITAPSLIGRIAAFLNKEPDTFNLVSAGILIIINIVFIIYTFVNYRKLKKKTKQCRVAKIHHYSKTVYQSSKSTLKLEIN